MVTLRESEALLSWISSCIMVVALLERMTAAKARMAATASAKSGCLRQVSNSSMTEKGLSASLWAGGRGGDGEGEEGERGTVAD